MKLQLRKPENWQDFEELCKILWGEIWNCPEIKKNGRSGQIQHGIDIYGKPSWEKGEYYGIQCKGKDDYTKSVLSEKEIDAEIKKAKKFKPVLKKIYFATTANKDAKLEEYVRIKDVESQREGGFEIHLFCWDDIVYLIDQNKRAHDWYVRKIDFKNSFNVEVSFNEGETEMEFSPVLLKNTISYKRREEEEQQPNYSLSYRFPKNKADAMDILRLQDPQPIAYYIDGVSKNKSSCEFYLILTNTGSTVIENYKLYIDMAGDILRSNTSNKQRMFLDTFKYTYNTFQIGNEHSFVFEPGDTVLVQKDYISTDNICFRPSEINQDVIVKWRLIARDFSKEGELKIRLKPIIKLGKSVEICEFKLPDEVRIENYYGR